MRAHNFKDITGRRFERLIALRLIATNPTKWECRCDCGTVKTIRAMHLMSGLIRSCGCLHSEVSAATAKRCNTKHGHSGKVWWTIWFGMMDRCYNSNFHRFHRYGGRGIAVCRRWHKAENFLADMGEPPKGLTLERIDNDGPYSPKNCRWATYKEQNNNRSSTRLITFNGETMSGAAWAERLGIKKAAMYARLKRWPLEMALTMPATAPGAYAIRKR